MPLYLHRNIKSKVQKSDIVACTMDFNIKS